MTRLDPINNVVAECVRGDVKKLLSHSLPCFVYFTRWLYAVLSRALSIGGECRLLREAAEWGQNGVGFSAFLGEAASVFLGARLAQSQWVGSQTSPKLLNPYAHRIWPKGTKFGTIADIRMVVFLSGQHSATP